MRWSVEATREALQAIPSLDEELGRRSGVVPVLRLPFPAEGRIEPGYDTVVVLPLRDGAAATAARGLLDAVDGTVLLSLPWLREVVVETGEGTRRLAAAWSDTRCTITTADGDGPRTTVWATARAEGTHAPAALRERPVEERARPGWSLLWAVPLRHDDDGWGAAVPDPASLPGPGVVRAPTPTDEPLSLPVMLVASFPLESTRRHVAPGPATDALVAAAAAAYVTLLADLAPGTALVPPPLPQGTLDAALHRAVRRLLPDVAFLPAVAAPGVVAPRDAVAAPALDEALADLLGDVVPGLLRPSAAADRQALAVLDVPVLPVGEVVDRLAGIDRPPHWWHRLYSALAAAGLSGAALEGLPVPLTDGRTVSGPRAVLLPALGADDGGSSADPVAGGALAEALDVLAPLGLRLVHPEAAHPLLERLGARRAGAEELLDSPACREAVQSAWDEPDPLRLAEAVLALAAAAGPGQAGAARAWLRELPLPDAAGGFSAAGQLVLDGSALHAVVEPGSLGVLEPAFASTHDRRGLLACGVLDSFAVGRAELVGIDDAAEDPELDVDGLLEWAEATGADAGVVAELAVVRDLDLVAEDCWPQALAMLSVAPLREVVLTPARVLLERGAARDVPSFSAWWLGEHARIDGVRPRELVLPDADPVLHRLYQSFRLADGGPDAALVAALGARVGLTALLAEPGGPDELLTRLADRARDVPAGELAAVYARLADVPAGRVTPPDHVRVPSGAGSHVVAAERVVVLDSPAWLQVVTGDVLVGDVRLADVLDLPTAAERHPGSVTGTGTPRPVSPLVAELLAGAPSTWVEHDDLVVDGIGVDWWVEGEGRTAVVRACTGDGLARGLAWAAAAWGRRWLVSALLTGPDDAARLLAEDTFG